MDKISVHRVGIFIYDDAEVLDFSGPFEVFSTAQRLIDTDSRSIEVALVAEIQAPVLARGGMKVTPNYSINQHPPFDTLIVVGGVHTQVMHNESVLQWLRQQSVTVKNLASVCTGVFLLAAAGIVDQHPVTTHWEDQDDLQQCFPNLTVATEKRWVEVPAQRPRIITSGGISAGIDMSLYLLSVIINKALAIRTAKQMEYDWKINP